GNLSNKGWIRALKGTTSIESENQSNAGKILGQKVSLKSHGNVTNTGLIAAQEEALTLSAKKFLNQGYLQAAKDSITVDAGNIVNQKGTIAGQSVSLNSRETPLENEEGSLLKSEG